jgi:hypothetical protein
VGSLKEKNHFEDEGVNGRTIIKGSYGNKLEGYGLD